MSMADNPLVAEDPSKCKKTKKSNSRSRSVSCGRHRRLLRRCDWANLPADLLGIIASKLALSDRIHSATICKTWYSVAAAHHPSFLSRLCKKPYLLVPPGSSGANGGRGTTLLVDVFPAAGGTAGPSPSPAASPSLVPSELEFGFESGVDDLLRDKWVVGSQFGWLAVVDHLSNPSLINPFTGSQIHLPPITAFRPFVEPVFNDDHGSPNISGYKISYPQHLFMNMKWAAFYPLEESLTDMFVKIIVCSNPTLGGDFSVLALFSGHSLVYTKAGHGDKWSYLHLNTPYLVSPCDIIYSESHPGKFLMLCNPYGDVFAIDADLSDAPIMTSEVVKGLGLNRLSELLSRGGSILAPNLTMIAKGPANHYTSRYLVEHPPGRDGMVLLQVCREVVQKGTPQTAGGGLVNTSSILVFAYDEREALWVPIDSCSSAGLGCHSLILGSCHSLSFNVSDALGLRPNCVYFSDCPWSSPKTFCIPDFSSPNTVHRYWMKTTHNDIGFHDIQNANTETIKLPLGDKLSIRPRPIWIVPSGLPRNADSFNLQDIGCNNSRRTA